MKYNIHVHTSNYTCVWDESGLVTHSQYPAHYTPREIRDRILETMGIHDVDIQVRNTEISTEYTVIPIESDKTQYVMHIMPSNYVVLWQGESIIARRQYGEMMNVRAILDTFLAYMGVKNAEVQYRITEHGNTEYTITL